MMQFVPRSVSNEADLHRIRSLIQAAWVPYMPFTYYHTGYLCLRMRDTDYVERLTLWETQSGDLAGFSEWEDGMFEWQLHPHYANTPLMAQILAWYERAATWGDWRADMLDTLCAEEDRTTALLLEQRGYTRTTTSYQHHLGTLDGDIRLPDLPEGYSVRPLAGPAEIEPRVAAHRAGWQLPSMTADVYQRLMRTPCYRPELDLVAIDPTGEIVACCNVWLDEVIGVGIFEPLSTHPDHRGKRLAQALVCKGMQQLRALGATQTLVLSASESPHVARLYERCGLPIVRRDFLYQKPITMG